MSTLTYKKLFIFYSTSFEGEVLQQPTTIELFAKNTCQARAKLQVLCEENEIKHFDKFELVDIREKLFVIADDFIIDQGS